MACRRSGVRVPYPPFTANGHRRPTGRFGPSVFSCAEAGTDPDGNRPAGRLTPRDGGSTWGHPPDVPAAHSSADAPAAMPPVPTARRPARAPSGAATFVAVVDDDDDLDGLDDDDYGDDDLDDEDDDLEDEELDDDDEEDDDDFDDEDDEEEDDDDFEDDDDEDEDFDDFDDD